MPPKSMRGLPSVARRQQRLFPPFAATCSAWTPLSQWGARLVYQCLPRRDIMVLTLMLLDIWWGQRFQMVHILTEEKFSATDVLKVFNCPTWVLWSCRPNWAALIGTIIVLVLLLKWTIPFLCDYSLIDAPKSYADLEACHFLCKQKLIKIEFESKCNKFLNVNNLNWNKAFYM